MDTNRTEEIASALISIQKILFAANISLIAKKDRACDLVVAVKDHLDGSVHVIRQR